MLGRLAGRPTSELGIGLGRDMRLEAPELAERYRQGLLAEGVHVIDIGQVGTEMLYWLVGSRELDGGLMCTASHNPKAYTGAKLVRRGAIPLSGDAGIQDIRREIENGMGKAPGGGTSETIDVYLKFQQAAFKFIDGDKVKPLKVVVDGGNGMAGPMIGPLLQAPEARPRPDVLQARRRVPRARAEPAAAREPRVHHRARSSTRARTSASPGTATPTAASSSTSTGTFVDGDFLTALLAESLLEKSPESTILYDVRASRAVADTVERLGGTALPNRVGHAFFKTRMREEDAIFGGEVSGHYYFRDFYCADSGTIPALLMLELLSTRGKRARASCSSPTARSTSSAARSTPRSRTRRRGCSRSRSTTPRRARASAISTASASTSTTGTSTSAPSNTEPLLRLCLESLVSQEDMERRRDEVLELIRG